MNALTSISLVRHGHVHNPHKIFYGRLPGFHLSEIGQLQAQSVAEHFRDQFIAASFCSPRLRAYQTAEIFLATHNSLTNPSHLLDEVNTPFDELPLSHMEERNWDVYTNVDPPYEQPIDVLARIKQFINQVRQQYTGQHIIAFTHGDAVAFMTLWVQGKAITPENRYNLFDTDIPTDYPEPASITTFEYTTNAEDEIPSVKYIRPYHKAAGGLVWRNSSQGRELAVIHRPDYDDWTLPKGWLNSGESWQDAACREVKEEICCDARILGFAGCSYYMVNGMPKIVPFWHMEVVIEEDFKPNKEVDQLLWLPIDQARERLDYPSEKRLLTNEGDVYAQPA